MSTFTDWNGPQGGGVRANDLIQLADAYSQLVAKLDQHMADKTPGTSDVHGIKTYVEAQIETIKNLIPSVSAFITEVDADTKYALKSQIPTDVVQSDDIADFATNAAVTALLANYLKTSELSSADVITVIQADITALEQALNADTFEKPILKATDYIEGLVHAVEQVKFTDKRVSAYIGGADSAGNYYLLGMLLDKAGTAYIKYTNTDPFSAVINFSYTPDDKGALSVVCDNAVWQALKFKIVAGTDAAGNKHAYLAVQAPDWVVNQIVFECAGINFVPVESEGWLAPNGNCHNVVDCFAYTGLSASQINIKVGDIGDVIGWSKFNADGVPTDIPDNCHVCDGSPVDPATWPELIAKGITKFPLVDYHIIVGKKTTA